MDSSTIHHRIPTPRLESVYPRTRDDPSMPSDLSALSALPIKLLLYRIDLASYRGACWLTARISNIAHHSVGLARSSWENPRAQLFIDLRHTLHKEDAAGTFSVI